MAGTASAQVAEAFVPYGAMNKALRGNQKPLLIIPISQFRHHSHHQPRGKREGQVTFQSLIINLCVFWAEVPPSTLKIKSQRQKKMKRFAKGNFTEIHHVISRYQHL